MPGVASRSCASTARSEARLLLAAPPHLLEALSAESQTLGRARLRPALPARILDHPPLELLAGRGERRGPGGVPGCADAVGEMLGPDRPAVLGQRHGALDLVLQLPDIAGKRIRLQQRHGFGGDARDGSPGAATGSPA